MKNPLARISFGLALHRAGAGLALLVFSLPCIVLVQGAWAIDTWYPTEKVTLSWDRVEGAAAYRVSYRAFEPPGPEVFSVETAGTQAPVTLPIGKWILGAQAKAADGSLSDFAWSDNPVYVFEQKTFGVYYRGPPLAAPGNFRILVGEKGIERREK